jgi:uncharacterized membrane protein
LQSWNIPFGQSPDQLLSRPGFCSIHYKIEIMKIVGIILILVGIGVFIFNGMQSIKKEKVLDVGPVEISKEVQRSDSWQLYAAGGIAVLAGIILVLIDRKKASA